MAPTNTIVHRRLFEGLISTSDQKNGEGDEVAFAILYAALAAARKRIGDERCAEAAREFLAKGG